MSLKYFHMIFVTAATLLCFGFAAWCFFSPDSPHTTAYTIAGVAAVFAGVAVMIYGTWVWKKLKKIPMD
jgi:hypothetical protein